MARRVFAIALTAGALLAGFAAAQNFPARPVRIIVPLAPGGGTDNLTRILAPKLSELLGQQIVVENRAGAGGQIGTDYVAKSAADGYTLLNVDTSFTSNPSLFAKLPYDSIKDFAPVSLLAAAPVALIVHPSVPARSLRELLILAKARPQLFNFAMGGYGSATHLAVEQFRAASAIDIVVIPYKGGGLATADVLAGQVVMDGFLGRRIPVGLRRLITMAPAIIIIAVGVNPDKVRRACLQCRLSLKRDCLRSMPAAIGAHSHRRERRATSSTC